MCYRFSLCAVLAAVTAIGTALGQDCRVTTTVRFLDQAAQPVSNIVADDLKAEIGGSPAKIIAVNPATKPAVVLLIDASSSIGGTWTQSIAAAKQFSASADDHIAAVVFRDRILAYAANRTETEKLLDELPRITPSRGGTA